MDIIFNKILPLIIITTHSSAGGDLRTNDYRAIWLTLSRRYISQSGQLDGDHLSISKKGNKQLRCLLYLAVTCNIRLKKVNPINQFYQKKRQQLNPLNSKAAKVACIAKLAKIIYGMCKNNTIFQR